MGIEIIGTGKALPSLIVDNNRLAEMVETDNQWIIDRTGIEARHVSTEETGLSLSAAAARDALGWTEHGWLRDAEKSTGIDPASIDLVLVATVSPDKLVPAMAALVKMELGLPNAIAFDVNIACSGFIYGTYIAESLIKAGLMSSKGFSKTNQIKRALVIGVERLSRITNWEDRGTCILFGDGAGAALLQFSEDRPGILGSFVKNYDDVNNTLTCGMEYLKNPFATDVPETMFLKMHGTQVFRFAVNAITEVMEQVLQDAGITADDITFFVPHQANMRIISYAAQKFKQPLEKFQVNIQTTGNVSAASIPMALSDLMRTGKVQPGDKIMMVGFGGGLSAGAILYEA